MSRAARRRGHPHPLGVLTADDLAASPSLAHLSAAEETRRLRRGVALLWRAGKSLGVTQETVAASLEYFLRFFVFMSLTHHAADDIAAAAMFLACKTQEESRRPRDVINVFHALLKPAAPPVPLSQLYWDAKAKLVADEHLILRVMRFETQVPRPHRLLLNFAFLLRVSSHVVQLAVSLLNDCYFSPVLCLTTPANVLACASLQVATILLNARESLASREMPWWEACGVRVDDLEPACQLLISTVAGTLSLQAKLPDDVSAVRIHGERSPHNDAALAVGPNANASVGNGGGASAAAGAGDGLQAAVEGHNGTVVRVSPRHAREAPRRSVPERSSDSVHRQQAPVATAVLPAAAPRKIKRPRLQ